MRKLVLLFLFFVASNALQSQELIWRNNINEAMQLSEQTKKPMMLFFTGSDWCGWCIRLQKEVFKKPEFATWAIENVILVEVDFPRKPYFSKEIQDQNNALQSFFEVGGYPTVWFVNATREGDKVAFSKLGSAGYMAGGPAVWVNAANEILKQK